MAERIRELAKGGEELLNKANLRPQDEEWWPETTEYIASTIISECEMRETSDEALIARIPQSAYAKCYSQRDRDEVTKERVAEQRRGGGWVLAIGYLIRDTERLLLEAIHMGDKVIRARSQIRAFAWVIAAETGLYEIKGDESFYGRSSSTDDSVG